MEFDIRQEAYNKLPFANEPSNEAVSSIISTLLSASMVIAAAVLFFNLILAAFEWLNSGGDSSKIEKAKTRISQSLIGLIILSAVLAIFSIVQGLFDLEIINFKFN